ncbi:MAG: RNA polymerase sigma factor [Phycisphaerae bacterium]
MDAGGSAEDYLIEQIRAGSEAAWRQMIDRYAGRLLAFARARSPSLSDADDLVQETLVGFLQSVQRFDSSRSLETYLFTILRYKLYDLLRRTRGNVVSEPADAEGWWDRVTPGTEETPSGAALRAEASGRIERLLVDILKQLIREMRDRQAFNDLQVIELAFFAGVRNLDIADLLEMDQKAVAGVKFRAIQKLKKYLAGHDAQTETGFDEASADVTVARVWREHRLTCLKRSTLGSYLLGVLEEPWRSYTQFHLDVVACSMCVANLADLESEEDQRTPADTQRMFASSVGFLKHSR